MKTRVLSDQPKASVHLVVLESGEEAFGALTRFADEQRIGSASITAIGAFERAVVGWFDVASKAYRRIAINEQCEVLSALGDIAVDDDDKPSLHMHVVLGLADGSTRGGHFLEGTVRPTLEIIVTETPVTLRRRKRKELGIALIDA